MHIIDVQLFSAVQIDVHAQASALLAPAYADIVISRFSHRESAEHGVPVGSAAQLAVLSQSEFQSQLARDEMRLIVSVLGAVYPQYFLKRDDVRIDLTQDLDNSFRPDPLIHPPTFMNVVGDRTNSSQFTHF